jgi:hypothetical protein
VIRGQPSAFVRHSDFVIFFIRAHPFNPWSPASLLCIYQSGQLPDSRLALSKILLQLSGAELP